MSAKWEIVIGLETHAQLSTVSKIFSGSSTAFGAAPNSQASAVDIALPGVLPVMNKGAVERAIRFGLAINAQLNRRSIFARKNYFYPDLPKGYQISQYELPIVGNGALNVVVGDAEKTIRITRAHLEEDAGKSLHEDSLRALGGASLNSKSGIDLNRAGTPLLEIVSEPDMRSAQEAVAYAKTLHALVRWIGICDGNMQEGSFRCDANVSVRRVGEEKFGTRCEIKNLNSFRFLEQAIEYEAQRQIELIEDGGTVVQETRLFDPDKGETRTMRSKEDAMDYRYFPDPDLPPLVVSEAWIDAVKKTMPALPAEKYRALIAAGIAPATATVLTENLATALYFEAASADANAEVARQIANWIAGAVNAGLNEAGVLIENSPVSAVQLRGLVERIVDGTISNRIAKEVFDALWNGVGKDADAVIEAKGLKQISDIGAIEKIVDEVLAKNPKSVEEYRAGKEKAFNALVGQVMKAMQGKANPAQVNALLKKKLDG